MGAQELDKLTREQRRAVEREERERRKADELKAKEDARLRAMQEREAKRMRDAAEKERRALERKENAERKRRCARSPRHPRGCPLLACSQIAQQIAVPVCKDVHGESRAAGLTV
jgi:hypothetical protein